MNDTTQKTPLPQLRFPQFKDVTGWQDMKLDDICKFTRGPFGGALKKEIFVKDGYAVYEQSHAIYSSFESFRYFISEQKFKELKRFEVCADDIIMSCSGTMGKFAIVPNHIKKGVINQALLKLTVKSGYDVRFIKTTLELPLIQEKLLSQSAGGAIKNVVEVSQIKEISLGIPSYIEQKKIADCLSSLDSLITAENYKLDAMKAHKRGLMQQLFPAEGETLPKLRFAEFIDSGEWELKSLGECLSRHPEYGIGAAAVSYSKNLPTYLRITDISDDGHFLKDHKVSVEDRVTNENYLQDGDIVLARTGASVGKSYKYRVGDGPLVFAGFLIRVRPDESKIDSELLFQYLYTEQYWEWVKFSSTRSGQPGINSKQYASMPISVPCLVKEQQKIASCLLSLDTMITSQAEKIVALKTHKQGLMQALFPNTNDL